MPKVASKIRHLEKKDLIRAEFLKCARASPVEIVSYSKFGDRTDTRPRGPSKAALDLIADEESAAGRPDITVLLVRKDTGYPGQIDGRKTRNPTSHDKARARLKLQAVIDLYNRGAVNPF